MQQVLFRIQRARISELIESEASCDDWLSRTQSSIKQAERELRGFEMSSKLDKKLLLGVLQLKMEIQRMEKEINESNAFLQKNEDR